MPEVHAAQVPVSILHSKLPASVDVNVKATGLVLLLPLGPLLIVVSGATVSAVQVRDCELVLPAASVERTVNVWAPWARPVYEAEPPAQPANAPLSSRHWSVPSLAENENVAVVLATEPEGPLLRVPTAA